MISYIFPFRVEPMKPADIAEVIVLEQVAYAAKWHGKDYDYELYKNKLAHYFVLRNSQKTGANIIGQGGFWLMAGELHINTIAIHPQGRRLGLGEWLLLNLVERGRALGALVATLEVRPSNQAALSLYSKYKFQKAGRRRHYYSDNGEDAFILTTPAFDLPAYQALLHYRKKALLQRLAKLNVDKTDHLG